MRILKVQAIFDHANGFPRDGVCSTFHFLDADDNADPGALATDVLDFYTVQAPTASVALGAWMSSQFTDVYAKCYEVNDVIVDGRLVSNAGEPLATTLERPMPAVLDPEALPAEVAVCLSVRNTTDVGEPRARRTGRIYFGPLNDAATTDTPHVVARPHVTLLADLRIAADKLKDDALANGGEWCVYSRPYGGRGPVERPGRTTLPALPARGAAAHVINQVWTDDAFDTQRRRGERATAKTILAV